MNTKICFKCNIEKPLDQYYKHRAMSDGHLGKCKECTKKDSLVVYSKLTSTVNGIELERERHREKYHRLGYKDKQIEYDKKREWKNDTLYRNCKRKISRRIQLLRSEEIHHWNYNLLESVFILNVSIHKKIHKLLIFDDESKCFIYKNELLDTKEKHESFLVDQIIKMNKKCNLIGIEIKGNLCTQSLKVI